MKKQLLAVLITIMLTSSSYPVVFVRSTPIKDALKTGEKHIELTFTLPEVIKAGNYDELKIPDCSYISTPGHPMLPIRSVAEKLPLNSHVTQITAKVENVSLNGNYFIMPALTPVQVGSTEPLNMSSPDQTIYSKDELYPNEWYVYRVGNGLDADSNRRVQYVSFYFYPLRYLPTEQKILLAQHVSLTITYTEPAEETTAQTVLKNLIITSDTLEPYAVQLAAYKNSTGISSRAVNLTWVYKNYGGIDRPEQIRNCIKGFVAAYGITYVTIFGDADQVPVRYAFVNDTQSGEPYVPTDLYYGDLDGTWDDNNDGIYGDRRYDNVDGIPDVYVGRIPPSLASYAQTAVDKIKGYHQQFNASESWIRRVVLAAGTGSGDGFSNPFGIAFPFLKNYTANININKDIVKLYEAYGNLSTGSMASEINKGALFLNFAGHGDPGLWLFYWVNAWLGWYNGYGIADVQALTNGFKLPVVTTMSCSTARFDDVDCIGEWFVLQPNGGSIAYFGATRIAWGYSDQWITIGLMGEIDWRIYQNFYEGWTRLGQMWGQTAKEYVQNHIWNYKYASMYDVKTLMEFVLLGDPTLRIYNPNYPETLRVPEDCRTIQGAINAAYDGDTITVSSGTYYENVVVNKSLSLIGQRKDNTIIDGNLLGNVVNITASNVKICNFTIRRSGTLGDLGGIVVNKGSRGNSIIGNIIKQNYYHGIYLDWSSRNNNVSGNIISTNTYFGIYIRNSGDNNIVGNNVTGCWAGINIWSDYTFSNNTLRNNIMVNNRYNFEASAWSLAGYTNDVDISNTVDGRPIYYWIGKADKTVPVDAGCVFLVNCTRITVQSLNLTRNFFALSLAFTTGSTISKNKMDLNNQGIYLYHSSNNSVFGNSIANSNVGAEVSYSSNNTVADNNITKNSSYGILIQYSSNNTIFGNNVKNSSYGVWLGWSTNNLFYHNNLANNSRHVYLYDLGLNSWDNGYPSGGNYWSNYTGIDLFNGPYQNLTGSDGIGDTPYFINNYNKDKYPLMKPDGWIHNTTIIFSLVPNSTYVGQTVTLQGTLKDEYNRPLNNTEVNVYLNGTLVEHKQTNSTGGFKTTLTPTTAGTYTVKISFNGSATLKPSSYMQTLTLLKKVSTKVSFTLSPNPAKMGATITLAGNLTDQANAPMVNVPVEVSYSIDNGVNWIYAGRLQTNSTGGFKATGKLTIVGIFLIKVSYKGNFKYNPSSHIETLTINP